MEVRAMSFLRKLFGPGPSENLAGYANRRLKELAVHQQVISLGEAIVATNEASCLAEIEGGLQNAAKKFAPNGSTAPILGELLKKTAGTRPNDLLSLKNTVTTVLDETLKRKGETLKAAEADRSGKALGVLLRQDPPVGNQ
jgi:hypothetical protein